jgi:hypothetical protein
VTAETTRTHRPLMEIVVKSRIPVYVCSLILCETFANGALAEQFIYPNKDQTPEQQKKDEFDCHTWAVQQAGYDPIAASQTPAAQAPTEKAKAETGSGAKGAVKGAAAGAAVGAIAGDAGKGAAVGAAAGGAGGRVRSKNQAEAKQQEQVAAANTANANQAASAENYNKARAACLEGKGYTVK